MTLAPALDRVEEASRRLARRRDAAPLVDRGQVEVARVFRKQGREMAAEVALLRPTFTEARLGLREDPTRGEWESAWRKASARVRREFEEAMRGISERGMAAGFASMAADLGSVIAFDLANPRAVAFMAERGAALVSRIDETTRQAMMRLLTQSVDNGWSYARTARKIKETFEGFAGRSPLAHIRSRAELVAVTEHAFAYEAGTKMNAAITAAELPPGLAMTKSWITAGDARVDEFPCTASEADGWIAFEEEHSGGFSEPPAHPGCRCTEAYSVRRSA